MLCILVQKIELLYLQDAISSRGHTKRGRVKQKGTKKADLVDIGTMVFEKAWCNAGEGRGIAYELG